MNPERTSDRMTGKEPAVDPKRFDSLTRVMSLPSSRRAIASLVVVGLATVPFGDRAASAGGRKRDSCKKKRHKTFGCTQIKGKRCRTVRKPDGARCRQNGQCFHGFCALPPDCQGVQGSSCTTGDDCCSGNCSLGVCEQGEKGARCIAGGDCLSGECVGFHCT
jgi:hypothetical protein